MERGFVFVSTNYRLLPGVDIAKGKSIPPFLILHVADHPDTTAQAQRLGAVLKAAGIPATVFGAKETTHAKINADLGLPDDPATKALFEFVDEALKSDHGSATLLCRSGYFIRLLLDGGHLACAGGRRKGEPSGKHGPDHNWPTSMAFPCLEHPLRSACGSTAIPVGVG